jgi:DNA-binding beta-propeller fold protein YncE
VAVDDAGNVFVADTGNGTVRRIGTDGTVTTVAGVPGRAGTALGPLPGGLSRPRSLAVTPDGDLVVLCGEGVVQITAP